jgi:hypothetical protein
MCGCQGVQSGSPTVGIWNRSVEATKRKLPSSQALLYMDAGDAIFIYTYPQGKFQESFHAPQLQPVGRECADSSGDVSVDADFEFLS